jgi:hypothetical protein
MFKLFLLALLGLPIALIVAPRAVYGWVNGLCWVLVGFLMWEGSRPSSIESGSDFAMAFAVVWGTFLGASWGVRAIFDAWYYRGREAPPIDYRPLWACLAIVATGWAGWLLGPTLARLFLPLSVLLIASIVAVALGFAAWHFAGRARWVSAAAAMTMIVGVVAILSWPSRITQAAQNQAHGRAYCLMVADGGVDYRPVTSRLDLTPLMMRASEYPWLRNQHGLMVMVDTPPRNFSYRQAAFADVANETPDPERPLCRPVRDFADRLPLW